MCIRTNNPEADYDRYSAGLEKILQKRPVCSECGNHIQDEKALHWGKMWLCEDCRESLMEYLD